MLGVLERSGYSYLALVVLRRRPGRVASPSACLHGTEGSVASHAHDVSAVEVVQHDSPVVVDEQLLGLHVHVDSAGDLV